MCETQYDDPVYITANTMNEIIDLMRISAIVLLGCNPNNKAELKFQLERVLAHLNGEDEDEDEDETENRNRNA